ncbi:MAG: recombinase family protein [Clostridiales bacterium]|nr:recombinase family protein [Clostridiales bacterium]
MRKVTKIEKSIPTIPKLIKVAAYVRVSMETEQLNHSLSAQISYYSNLIQSNSKWQYAGVYADSFITGTSTKHRKEFQRLIADCEKGKIDIILCKSISRFARNTVDLLETVRHLKDLGIEVRFERENISTFSGDGELMLSILASFAQEESKSISENTKWAKKKRMEKGKPNGGFRTYGYKWNGEKFEIVPEEAEVVKLIFSNYLNGIYADETAEQLKKMGVKTCFGNEEFNYATIQQMLKNEKYTGSMILQKYYRQDVLTKKQVKNKGELPMVYVENSHEAIISKEDFDKVQEIIKKRAELGAISYTKINTSCLTKKIKCGCCGKNYQRATQRGAKQQLFKVWQCGKKHSGKGCKNIDLPEEQLKSVCSEMLGIAEFDDDVFEKNIESIVVNPNNVLEFHFLDGEIKIHNWIPIPKPSRSERMKGNTYGKLANWSEERRKAQSERMKLMRRKLNAK